MSEQHDLALRLALVKVLTDRLKDVKAAAGCEVTDTWRPKDRATVVLPGSDAEIGTVTLSSGSTKARLSDEDAYRTWVEANYPEQIETVTTTRIKPEFTNRLLTFVQRSGKVRDPGTGQEVPGVVVETGDPHPMVKLVRDAPELFAQAWR
ncbi:hypothetical protein ACFQ07_14095, partial [Actinomadura adrarensis]